MQNIKKITLLFSLLMALVSCNFNRATLENTIEEINHLYPAPTAAGIVAERISIEGDYVVYHFVVDESMYRLESFNELSPETMLADLQSQGVDMRDFLRLVKRCNLGIRHEYRGLHSGMTATCTADNAML